MKRLFKRTTLLIVLLICLSACFFVPKVFAENSFEYWNVTGADWEFYKDLKLDVAQEFRFATDGRGFYRTNTDVGLGYSGLTKYLDLGFTYRFILDRTAGAWLAENRIHMDATPKISLYGFDLSSRNRFEYRSRNRQFDGWRYRNKFKIKLPWKLTRFEMQPYVAEEFYIDFHEQKLSRNRIYSGIDFQICKYLAGRIYYIWQIDNRDHWDTANIFGTDLKISF